ncbi:hypothetical protein MLD38_011636 [Melastoma candidum]|uniref:Uncharacterized protein n=1 Tax=Melastoma candidum TaxID=119954 RepID=A0ACB9R516_9MYRT|nr:hypothetical protein MLD38_011636 [Melastoma candidum]
MNRWELGRIPTEIKLLWVSRILKLSFQCANVSSPPWPVFGQSSSPLQKVANVKKIITYAQQQLAALPAVCSKSQMWSTRASCYGLTRMMFETQMLN